MPQEIERELVKCEQALYQMQTQYPVKARTAAEARLVYDLKWAEAIDEINHRAITDGTKLTVAACEALATKKVAKEMEAARIAEAELDSAKRHLSSLEAILSSVQTRAGLIRLEMSLEK